jgi:hypothetical protein
MEYGKTTESPVQIRTEQFQTEIHQNKSMNDEFR